MGIGIAIGLGVASAAASGVMGGIGANSAEDALQAQIEAAKGVLKVKKHQLHDQSQFKQEQRQRGSHQTAGAIRAAAAGHGVDLAGTYAQLLKENKTVTQQDIDQIKTNTQNMIDLATSKTNAGVARLQSQMPNMGLAIAGGAISGFGTGLSMGSSINSLLKTK